MEYTKDGRIIKKDGKELFSIHRIGTENGVYNLTPCETDAMAYFVLDALNNGNFAEYYKKYMAS